MPHSQFANNLKFLRRMKSLSQQKLAEQVGLKRNNIASYEAGIVEPKAINFLKLALFFKAAPRELLEEDLTAGFLEAGQDGGKNTAVNHEELLKRFRLFSSQTVQTQKVLEGFREFQKLTALSGPGEAENSSGHNNSELDNLLGIMEQLLACNWKLIRAMTMTEIKDK